MDGANGKRMTCPGPDGFLDVVMLNRLVDNGIQMTLAKWNNMPQALGLIERTNRSANAFRLGLFAGIPKSLTLVVARSC